ncbi:MAG: hypothetical protein V1836_04095 [Candidatus Aenigmatarchaeota archaeon]
MDKQDIKSIRESLEKGSGFYVKVRNAANFVKNYHANPKQWLGFEIAKDLPLPKGVKKKMVQKLGLPDYTDNMYNKAMVKRYTDRGQYLKAYEAFWSTWNKPSHDVHRRVYTALGGNKHPVRASIGSILSSSFSHTITVGVPVYVIEALAGYANAIPYTAGAIAGLFALAGAPVAYSKWRESRKNR